MASLIMNHRNSDRYRYSPWEIFANHIVIAHVCDDDQPELTIDYLPEWVDDNWDCIADDYDEDLKPEEIVAHIEEEERQEALYWQKRAEETPSEARKRVDAEKEAIIKHT
jgi:hypothetical protein